MNPSLLMCTAATLVIPFILVVYVASLNVQKGQTR